MSKANRLYHIIRSTIEKDGPITFSRFMDLALYHPEHGYYSTAVGGIGKRGDYYTSPHASSVFGQVISNFIRSASEVIGQSGFTVVEVGGGVGYLALDILDALKKREPEFYNHITYVLIEHSNKHREGYRDLLKAHLDRIKVFSELEGIESPYDKGVVVSNEFFDALPFHRVVARGAKLLELYVDVRGGEFIEITDTPSTVEIEKYFEDHEIELADGQQAEVCITTRNYINNIASAIYKGLVLTIDYGFLAKELYDPARLSGTYKCVKDNRINENPYEDIGRQDITAHVDFSNLIRVGEACDLNTFHYTTQGQFLVDWGILEIIEALSSNSSIPESKKSIELNSIKTLFLPEQMGNKFRVLIQDKDTAINFEKFYPDPPVKISFNPT